MIKNLDNYGDILAIPFFILSSIYFILKSDKNILEYILMLFSISGAIADIYFTYNFFTNIKPKIGSLVICE